MDVLPTVADLCDVKPSGRIQGRSLLGQPRTSEQPIFFELTTAWKIRSSEPGHAPIDLSERWCAVLQGRYKYIVRDVPAERLLYDVSTDPREQVPLTQSQPAIAAGFAALLKNFDEHMRIAAREAGKPASVVLSPQEEARLRSLGYLP